MSRQMLNVGLAGVLVYLFSSIVIEVFVPSIDGALRWLVMLGMILLGYLLFYWFYIRKKVAIFAREEDERSRELGNKAGHIAFGLVMIGQAVMFIFFNEVSVIYYQILWLVVIVIYSALKVYYFYEK